MIYKKIMFILLIISCLPELLNINNSDANYKEILEVLKGGVRRTALKSIKGQQKLNDLELVNWSLII